MAVLVLRTKLRVPPPRPHPVARPRLLEQLSLGLSRKLTLVSAPAGFGKTTLVSEWVHGLRGSGRAPRVAWLSLDGDDNDPARFWAHVIAALRTIPELSGRGETAEGGVGQVAMDLLLTPDPLASSARQASHAPLSSLINDVAERVAGDLVLVVDDLHVVDAAEIHDGLVYFLEHMPSQMHLVVASRSDPPWPLARWRARGELAELRAKDLRFTPLEASAFLQDVMGLALSPQELAVLNTRTEGWVAGLQMAALSIQGRTDAAQAIAAFGASHRFVLDYLAQEVLGQQPDEVRAFMLHTSILDRVSAPACSALTGRADSQALLERLEGDNLFTMPLDEERRSYRYHPLFGDLLRSRLARETPELVPELHRRASEWFEREGQGEEAISHALAAGDLERALRLVEGQVPQVCARGEFALLRRWLDALPKERVRASPTLCVGRAWAAWAVRELDAVEAWLRHTEAALESGCGGDGDAGRGWVEGHVAVLRAVVARSRGVAPEVQLVLLHRAQGVIPRKDAALRSVIAVWLGMCYMDLEREEEADRTFQQVWEVDLVDGVHWSTYIALYVRTILARRRGQLHQAAALCREATCDLARRGRPALPAARSIEVHLGRVLLEWNDLEGARTSLSGAGALAESEGVGRASGVAEIAVKAAFARARLQLALGQKPLLPDLGAIGREGGPSLARYAGALAAWLQLMAAQHRPDRADTGSWWAAVQAWARQCPLEVNGVDWMATEQLVRARILVASYRAHGEPALQPVLDYLDEQLALLQRMGRVEAALDARIVQAMALDALGREREALAALEGALALASPGGYKRIFLDEGPPMARLLHLAAARGIGASDARALLTALVGEMYAAGRTPAGRVPPGKGQQALVEPLTPRELEVLRLLDTALSRPEMARELSVSVNTVRTHVRRIYGKLDAHSRDEALARGAELGLL
jgi:LuxR family maltose regulon positive regulatory protein